MDAEPVAAEQLGSAAKNLRQIGPITTGSHSFSDLLYKAPKEVVEELAEVLGEEEEEEQEGDEEGERVAKS